MGRKIFGIILFVLGVGLGIFLYVRFAFVYREGVNSGAINYFQREGFIFKTYEGKMIQTGYNSSNKKASIQSNEFKFSVKDQAVADELMRHTGKTVQLHWQYYLGTLPWRGNSNYIVDKIEYIQESSEDNSILFLPSE